MAVPFHALVFMLGTIASITLSVSAQGYDPDQEGQFFQPFDGLEQAYKQASAGGHGKLFTGLDGVKNLPKGLGAIPAANDIREWLIVKAKERNEGKAMMGVLSNGLADTPLGNISETCYNDIMRLFDDIETFQTYAMKMYSSWGTTTDWIKAWFTGNAKSYGAYELCVGVTEGKDLSPFDAQYCVLTYPILSTIIAQIGSCWPSTCSATELTIAHKTYLGDIGELLQIDYDCLVDFPWTTGAIVTVCVISLFTLLLVIGSAYHVIGHNHVTIQVKQLNTSTPKASENTYEQVVEDENPKGDPLYEAPHSVVDVRNEKCIETKPGESDGNENHEKTHSKLMSDTKSYGATKLEIEDGNAGNGLAQEKSHHKLVVDRLLMSFSVFENTQKIFATRPSSSMLGALDGMRVLSMWWVILIHANSFPRGQRYDNAPYYINEISTKAASYALDNGTYSVDTFFVLSGLLVTYLTLKQLAKSNGTINWFLFYFHRFWRITPAYLMTLAIVATLPNYLGKGAGKNSFFVVLGEACQKYWWTHPLYINNLYPYPGNIDNGSCMGWTWYLANDMQFYIISPFIIFSLYKSWKWGLGLISCACLVSFGSTIYVMLYWGLSIDIGGRYNNRTAGELDFSSDIVYTKPWCRISPFLVGMVLGYIVYKMNGKPYRMKMWFQLTGWALATAMATSVIYGLKAARSGPPTPQWLAVLYQTFSRFAFSLGVGWVLLVCVTGNGGYVNKFLAWNAWAPLAKLSFGAYLVHPAMIYLVIFAKKTTLHWTYVEFSYWFIANVVASYACAYLLSLLVEGPFAGIEKLLIGRPSSDKKRK